VACRARMLRPTGRSVPSRSSAGAGPHAVGRPAAQAELVADRQRNGTRSGAVSATLTDCLEHNSGYSRLRSPIGSLSTLRGFWSQTVIADLDTLLTALYVELTDRIIPSQAHSAPEGHSYSLSRALGTRTVWSPGEVRAVVVVRLSRRVSCPVPPWSSRRASAMARHPAVTPTKAAPTAFPASSVTPQGSWCSWRSAKAGV
jgi:hypothetical protein